MNERTKCWALFLKRCSLPANLACFWAAVFPQEDLTNVLIATLCLTHHLWGPTWLKLRVITPCCCGSKALNVAFALSRKRVMAMYSGRPICRFLLTSKPLKRALKTGASSEYPVKALSLWETEQLINETAQVLSVCQFFSYQTVQFWWQIQLALSISSVLSTSACLQSMPLIAMQVKLNKHQRQNRCLTMKELYYQHAAELVLFHSHPALHCRQYQNADSSSACLWGRRGAFGTPWSWLCLICHCHGSCMRHRDFSSFWLHHNGMLHPKCTACPRKVYTFTCTSDI